MAWTLVPFILSLLGECWSYSDIYGYHVKQRKTQETIFCIELIYNHMEKMVKVEDACQMLNIHTLCRQYERQTDI